jgi:hypothetical protein
MFHWLLIASSLFVSTAQALTQTQFLPGNYSAMAYVRAQGDNDPTSLYQVMNVPPQNSILGVGKAIVSSPRDFNLTCSQGQNLCSIVLNHSARVVIISQQKIMSFTAEGADADQLGAQFVQNAGHFEWLSTDHKMRITATPGHFEFLINEAGL